jgi:hypothetical protein
MRALILWPVLFGICLELGYPTLNRCDPRKTGGLSDTETYYELTVHGPANQDAVRKYRVLVPFLAKPVAHLDSAQGFSLMAIVWNLRVS